jgi:nucleoside-diphosphate-sugar epimerase
LKTLITGGGGFIGRLLAGQLIEAGHRVSLLDRQFTSEGLAVAGEIGEAIEADITDGPRIIAEVERLKPDGIVHLAAILSNQCEVDPPLAFAVNVGGMFNVLEGARRAGVGKVLATSSVAVLDAVEPTPPMDEDADLNPFLFYAITKAHSEEWCAFYHRRFGIDTRVARPGAVIGPGRTAHGAASQYTSAIVGEPLAGRPYVCPLTPDDSSPVVYITDLVDGLARLYLADSVPHRLYHLGAGSVSAGELARLVKERIPGADITFELDPIAQYVVSRWRYVVQDSSRAARDLGWRPRYATAAQMVDAFITDTEALAS